MNNKHMYDIDTTTRKLNYSQVTMGHVSSGLILGQSKCNFQINNTKKDKMSPQVGCVLYSVCTTAHR